MKKLIASIKNAVKAVEGSNKQMAQMTHYQALNPMSYYYVNCTARR